MRQNDVAKHVLIVSHRCDALAIIVSHEAANEMFKAVKDRCEGNNRP